jgi:beta-glucosidase/6-phospho-beta-glucosidase/beta-galactosidase
LDGKTLNRFHPGSNVTSEVQIFATQGLQTNYKSVTNFVWREANSQYINCSCRFLEPIISGRYPDSMVKIVQRRLPAFSADESRIVKGSIDYVGINQYTSYYMKDPGAWNMTPVSYQDDWHVGFACEISLLHSKSSATCLHTSFPQILIMCMYLCR